MHPDIEVNLLCSINKTLRNIILLENNYHYFSKDNKAFIYKHTKIYYLI